MMMRGILAGFPVESRCAKRKKVSNKVGVSERFQGEYFSLKKMIDFSEKRVIIRYTR